MKKYKAYFAEEIYFEETIEAKNKQEALKKAKKIGKGLTLDIDCFKLKEIKE